MWRFALSRRWWVGHVLVLVACVTFMALGDWQWVRARSATGDAQNVGYALQWPLFAVVLVLGWVQVLRMERRRALGVTASPRAEPTPPPPLARSTNRRTPDPVPEDDPDDELAAYNAFLAGLAARDLAARELPNREPR